MICMLFSVADLEGYGLPGLVRVAPGNVPGALYDDAGFPAVVHGADGIVHGTIWAIQEEGGLEALRIVDAIHGIGPDGPTGHVRTIVKENDWLLSFAWHWTSAPPSPRIESGMWLERQKTLPLTRGDD